MLVLVFIVLVGIGLTQSMSWGEVCRDENPVFLTYLGGVSACIAMIGTVMTAYGEKPHTMMAVIGLLGTVILNIMPIKEGLDYQAKTKYAKEVSAFTRFTLGPVWAWFRHTMVGIGKCARILICCTLIGIPMMRSLDNAERRANAYARQRELQELKEHLDELERINLAAAEERKQK